MNQYSFPILSLLARVSHISTSVLVAWDKIEARSLYDNEAEVLRRVEHEAASVMSREFVGHVVSKAEVVKMSEPLGLRLTMHGYCMTHRQLVELLADAFQLGQKDVMARTPVMTMGKTP
jgi:hypothetical protein